METALEGARNSGVDPGQVATAQGQIAMLLGNLGSDPDQLLGVYERAFDDLPARRAIEQLAERALVVLPDTPQRDAFAVQWRRLQEQLEDRLPERERGLRRDLAELEQVGEYLGNVSAACAAAIRHLADPRQPGGNLTAFSQAVLFEKEHAPESATEQAMPLARVG